MGHLGREELVDLLDGAPTREAATHLRVCDACRRELRDMQSVLEDVLHAEIPEPSPLFWNHLSAHVHRAVQAEQEDQPPGWIGRRGMSSIRFGASWSRRAAVIALAVLIATTAMLMQGNRPGPEVPDEAARAAAVDASLIEPPIAGDDASLAIVADLAADVDWDSARESGFTTHFSEDDDAVSVLTADERSELGRLLQRELGLSRRGA
jgi:hypothetical protein